VREPTIATADQRQHLQQHQAAIHLHVVLLATQKTVVATFSWHMFLTRHASGVMMVM
jgi:hypothetical protein